MGYEFENQELFIVFNAFLTRPRTAWGPTFDFGNISRIKTHFGPLPRNTNFKHWKFFFSLKQPPPTSQIRHGTTCRTPCPPLAPVVAQGRCPVSHRRPRRSSRRAPRCRWPGCGSAARPCWAADPSARRSWVGSCWCFPWWVHPVVVTMGGFGLLQGWTSMWN